MTPLKKKNGGNLNVYWVLGYNKEMLIWASVIRRLCCKKKKIKVIQLEIWIELTGEIT